MACEKTKVTHPSLEDAQRTIVDLFEADGRILFSYYCKPCDGFHLTSTKKPGFKHQKARRFTNRMVGRAREANRKKPQAL